MSQPNTIRGTNIVSGGSSTSSLTISFPAGTQAGDFAILFAGTAWNSNPVPAGWTDLGLYNATLTWNQYGYTKTLTASDISAGNVTVSFGGSYNAILAIVTFAGSTGGIREIEAANSAGGPITLTNTTTSAVVNSDLAIYWASDRLTGGPATVTITPSSGSASTLQTDAANTATVLASQNMPGGSISVANYFSAAGAAACATQVIIKGMSQITVGGNTFNLITIPSYPCFADIQMTIQDATAIVQSAYVLSQWQTQAWPGSDAWSAQCNLPPMDPDTAAPWRAFLADAAGMLNVFQLGDQGSLQGFARFAGGFKNQSLQFSNPVVDGTVSTNNPVSGKVLATKGWKPSTFRLLMPGTYLQVGYRLHMVAGQVPVNSDSSGKAAIPVWPSLRETPPDGTALILTKPVGLFRLAQNKRDWHTAVTRFTSISFKVVEVR